MKKMSIKLKYNGVPAVNVYVQGQTQWRKLCTPVRKNNKNKKLWSFWKV